MGCVCALAGSWPGSGAVRLDQAPECAGWPAQPYRAHVCPPGALAQGCGPGTLRLCVTALSWLPPSWRNSFESVLGFWGGGWGHSLLGRSALCGLRCFRPCRHDMDCQLKGVLGWVVSKHWVGDRDKTPGCPSLGRDCCVEVSGSSMLVSGEAAGG